VPLRVTQAGEEPDPVEVRRDSVLVCTPDRALCQQVIGNDGLQNEQPIRPIRTQAASMLPIP